MSSSLDSPSIATPAAPNSLTPSTPVSDDLMSPTSVKTVDDQEAIHEKLREKVKLRDARIKQNQVQAQQLAQSGDESMKNCEYAQATLQYTDAIRKWNTNVELYVKLATACVKCGQYEQAAFIATRALTLDPKNLSARYQRGLARFSQGLLRAAQVDLECILSHSEPGGSENHTLAATTLEQVNACITSNSSNEGLTQKGSLEGEKGAPEPASAREAGGEEGSTSEQELDFEFPRHEKVELDIAELSDSEECLHLGNRVPCRYHNRRDMGCERGSACGYMHAPDEKSVRDTLGRNVCVYLLLGSCRYQDRCVYSHSKDWLSTSKGWWNSSAQTDRMRNLVSLAEKNAKEQRELDRHLQLQRIQLQRQYRSQQQLSHSHSKAGVHIRTQAHQQGQALEQDRTRRQSNGNHYKRSNETSSNGATGKGRQQQQQKSNSTRHKHPRGQSNQLPVVPTSTMNLAKLAERMDNLGFNVQS
ncbi:hypothetical protein NP233_g3887 [Leucocoprinus birnbaumii]|uniref:C3H1-type domain-containing protein n=1 Tax=Leucocoprinus birnbaumii TaxID=56174 RepID=A0AAD5VW69_9AGAR|nr:hypothetical protein NP233_g3887 [Leucocoprinus birnbaumii]